MWGTPTNLKFRFWTSPQVLGFCMRGVRDVTENDAITGTIVGECALIGGLMVGGPLGLLLVLLSAVVLAVVWFSAP